MIDTSKSQDTNISSASYSSSVIMRLKGVTKVYPSFSLGPIDESIHSSQIIALMGKNGSGKTTLLKILTASMDATEGDVIFCNESFKPDAYLLKRSLGYLPQHSILPRWSTGMEILSYASKLYGLSDKTKIEQALSYWDALSYASLPMGACSHGMQKRVSLALATMFDPDLLVLDEPFSGLDLYHIKALTDEIERRKSQNKATLICTHMAPYAASLCTDIWIMNQGKLQEIKDWNSNNFESKIHLIEQAILDPSSN